MIEKAQLNRPIQNKTNPLAAAAFRVALAQGQDPRVLALLDQIFSSALTALPPDVLDDQRRAAEHLKTRFGKDNYSKETISFEENKEASMDACSTMNLIEAARDKMILACQNALGALGSAKNGSLLVSYADLANYVRKNAGDADVQIALYSPGVRGGDTAEAVKLALEFLDSHKDMTIDTATYAKAYVDEQVLPSEQKLVNYLKKQWGWPDLPNR
jgi:hypothetical protein